MSFEIIDSLNLGVIALDLKGAINYINDAAKKYFFLDFKHNSYTIFDIFPFITYAEFESIRTAVLFNEKPALKSGVLNVGESESKHLELDFSPIKDKSGLSKGIAVSVRELRDFEKAASNSMKLVETAPDAMVIVNQNGQIILVNAQTESLFGYSRDELLGKAVEILIPEKFKHSHQKHTKKYSTNPKTRKMGQGMDLFGVKKNGSTFPIEISLSPLKTEKSLYVSAAVRDVTERKIAEREREALLQLKTKNKELEQFAYVASHDLQEPLRTISSFVNILESKKEFDEESTVIMKYITESVGRMNDLINDLLDYSLIGQNRDLSIVDLNILIKEVLSDFKQRLEETKCNVSVMGPLPKVKAVRTEMRRLFQNLIINAIKFSKNEENPYVEISAQELKNSWQFAIKDNGIGIKKNFQDKIFTIFKRLNKRQEYQGTGIGLAQCQKVVELHGGEIWVDSIFGEGSTFYFTILK